MKDWTADREKEVQRFRRFMIQRRYSPKTIDTYVAMIRNFLLYFYNRPLDEIRVRDIEEFNYDFI
jgi:hypothetical protein